MKPDGGRAFLIILDGVGVGGAPDASLYGDEGSDTLGNLSRAVGGLHMPNFRALGLGNLSSIEGLSPVSEPVACFGRMEEKSAGKDSIAGHWEIAGVVTKVPFPVFPDGFPPEVVSLVEGVAGRKIIGNVVGSGTVIMDQYGAEHLATGSPILYTSADSVLQLLAHEEVIPLEEQYRICEEVHKRLKPPYRVARVIARPFVGKPGAFVRTPNRRDFAYEPPERTVIDLLADNNLPVVGVGKVDTLFAGRGFSDAIHTSGNEDGIARIRHLLETFENGLVFANLIDFDMLWGHRNDVAGFHRGLEELDRALPSWLKALRAGDLLLITADHGNDPTTPSTDHSREHVPLLSWIHGRTRGSDLGVRRGFSDVAATIADFFGLSWRGAGTSFLKTLTAESEK